MAYRIQTYIVKPSHRWYKEIDFLSYLSKNLYNSSLYYERQAFFNTNKFPHYYELNNTFTHSNQEDYRALPAKVSKRILTHINKRDCLIIYIKQRVVSQYFMKKGRCPLSNKDLLSCQKHQ